MGNNSGSECYTFEDVRKMLVLSPSRCNDLFNRRTKGSEDFPGFKVGRTWRVRKKAYDEWIKEQEAKISDQDEIVQEVHEFLEGL